MNQFMCDELVRYFYSNVNPFYNAFLSKKDTRVVLKSLVDEESLKKYVENNVQILFKYDNKTKTRVTILIPNDAKEEFDSKYIGIVYQDRKACLYFAEKYEDGNFHLIEENGKLRIVASLNNIDTVEDFWNEIKNRYTTIDFKNNTVLHYRKDHNRYYLYDFDLSNTELIKHVLKINNIDIRYDRNKNLKYIGENSDIGYFIVPTKDNNCTDYTIDENELNELVMKNECA